MTMKQQPEDPLPCGGVREKRDFKQDDICIYIPPNLFEPAISGFCYPCFYDKQGNYLHIYILLRQSSRLVVRII